MNLVAKIKRLELEAAERDKRIAALEAKLAQKRDELWPIPPLRAFKNELVDVQPAPKNPPSPAIDTLPITVRACNRLKDAGIRTVAELASADLSAVPGLGARGRAEIQEAIAKTYGTE